jgi:hypothetical protein
MTVVLSVSVASRFNNSAVVGMIGSMESVWLGMSATSVMVKSLLLGGYIGANKDESLPGSTYEKTGMTPVNEAGTFGMPEEAAGVEDAAGVVEEATGLFDDTIDGGVAFAAEEVWEMIWQLKLGIGMVSGEGVACMFEDAPGTDVEGFMAEIERFAELPRAEEPGVGELGNTEAEGVTIEDCGVGFGATVALSSGLFDDNTMFTTEDVVPTGVGDGLATTDGVPGVAAADRFVELQSADALESSPESSPIKVTVGESAKEVFEGPGMPSPYCNIALLGVGAGAL